MKVIRIKVDQKLSYPKAQKRFENQRESYAAAVDQQNKERLKIKELMKQMEEKDAQISQLLDATKKKDEQIEKMMEHIKNMKTENENTQTETQQLKAQRTTPMQLRNRPATVTEPKRREEGKKSKRSTETGNKKTKTSPGRQSPPLKKTNTETSKYAEDEVVELNEHFEIDETQPSQSIRRSFHF